MFYHVKHVTSYRYSEPIRENHMELRMQPRTEGFQRCWNFTLATSPRAEFASFLDAMDNIVHAFDIPGAHERLVITAEAVIEVTDSPALPEALDPAAWNDLAMLVAEDDRAYEMLQPSRFACPTAALDAFAQAHAIKREADPLSSLRGLNHAIFRAFEYAPQSTRVDSPIDEALTNRRGVCQDFSHIFIAVARSLGVPCRYVSGYLFHRTDEHDRSQADATHAWVEALLPGLGWVGFDPTNDLLAAERHVRTAIGRDYGDVPPTRGVFKGHARTESELTVSVRVGPSHVPPVPEHAGNVPAWSTVTPLTLQQAQQQQQ